MATKNINAANISSIRLAESAAPATPASGFASIYAKTDGKIYVKDDAGTETVLNFTPVATDAIWDAKGDLAVGTGANTAAKLTVGATNGHVLTIDSGEATGLKYAAVAPTDATYITTSANTTLSAEKVLPYLANYNPDKAPASPSAYDDEFDDDSISVDWTQTGSPDTISESTYRGFLYLEDNDSGACGVLKSYAPGANALTIVAKVSGTLVTDYSYITLIAQTSVPAAIATVGIQHRSGAIRTRSINGTTEANVTINNSPYTTRDYYLMLQRDNSQAWKTMLSTDGINFWTVGSFNNNATIANFFLALDSLGTNVASCKWDFVRVFASQTTVIGAAP